MDCDIDDLKNKANVLRLEVVKATSAAGSGHPGGSLSSAELMTALYFRVMRHDPKDPQWEDRDRFILSKGHVAPILYAALAEAGYFPKEELASLRKMGSMLQGHPVRGKVPGVEMSTGSLGQGLSMACGMALAAKLDNKDHKIYCLMGDGELQSGQNWEAAMLASHYRLNNIIGFVDRNHLQINGDTEDTMSVDPLSDKWRAFGWNVIIADGHDMCQILTACEKAALSQNNPTIIILKTVKGKGVSFMENRAEFHGKVCKGAEKDQAIDELCKVIR